MLSHFDAQEDHLLDAGDLLYLPPGVGHWGLAEQGDELCQTYSIGLRAPEPRELLAYVAQALLEAAAGERYSDPDLQPAPARAELAPEALKRLLGPLRQVLALSDGMCRARWRVTSPRRRTPSGWRALPRWMKAVLSSGTQRCAGCSTTAREVWSSSSMEKRSRCRLASVSTSWP